MKQKFLIDKETGEARDVSNIEQEKINTFLKTWPQVILLEGEIHDPRLETCAKCEEQENIEHCFMIYQKDENYVLCRLCHDKLEDLLQESRIKIAKEFLSITK